MYWFFKGAESQSHVTEEKNHGISRDDFETLIQRFATECQHSCTYTMRQIGYTDESQRKGSPSSLGMERVPAWKQNVVKWCEMWNLKRRLGLLMRYLQYRPCPQHGSVVQQLQTCAALCQVIFKLCSPNSSFLEPQPLLIEIRLTKNIAVTLTDVPADFWNHWLWVRKAPNKSIPTLPLPPRAHVRSHVRPGVHPRAPPRTLLHVRK